MRIDSTTMRLNSSSDGDDVAFSRQNS